MPAPLRGSETAFRLATQPTPGTLPAGNWNIGHFYSESFEPGQALEQDPELGGVRHNAVDPTDPVPGLDAPSGTLSVPLDLNQIGHYLKSLLGDPVTTGVGPDYTHTFTSGKDVLPALALEFANGADLFKEIEYAVITQASFDLATEGGYRKIDLSTLPRRVYEETATQAGVPVAAPSRAKVPGKIGLARFNGTLAANLLGGSVNIANGAEGERYADDSAFFGSIDPGDPSFTAQPEIRVKKTLWASLKTLFDGVTPFAFEVEYQLSATSTLILTAPRCFAGIVVPAMDGPGMTSVTPDIRAAQDATNPMLTVVLKNQVASY